MYGNRINTDVMLANLFESKRKISYTFDEIANYNRYLMDMNISTASDFCEDSVRMCADHYPELFHVYEDNGRLLVECNKDKTPNIEFFNAAFSNDMKSCIKRVTSTYIDSLSKA